MLDEKAFKPKTPMTPEELREMELGGTIRKIKEIERYFDDHREDMELCLEDAKIEEGHPLREQLAYIERNIGSLEEKISSHDSILSNNNLNDRLGNFTGTLSMFTTMAKSEKCRKAFMDKIISDVDYFHEYLRLSIEDDEHLKKELSSIN